MRFPALLALVATTTVSFGAEDGAQVYNTLCVACHGPDGKGLNGLPPLVGSDWPKGQAERSIKIVLNGMTGPVEVAGKAYNIVMPPQGAVLSDEKIAAALTYVRKTFAGNAGAVTPELVKSVRVATATRDTPWTADELLKDHPFPPAKTALRNLVGTMYKGEWKEMPDFSKLKPAQIEDENTGIISPAQSGLKDAFAMVWTAQFQAPEDGKYTFVFDCDDFGALYVNGERVAEIKGIGPVGDRRKEVSVLLKKGAVPFRLEYVEFAGQEVIILGYKGPKDKDYKWLSDTKLGGAAKAAPKRAPIPVEAKDGYTANYRNFIGGTTPRAIGFGFPNATNLTYSADDCAVELLWTGKFMDAAYHWVDRGQGNAPPAGDGVVKVSDGMVVAGPSAPSGAIVSYQVNKDGGKGTSFKVVNEPAEFKGYQLDKNGNPTFKVSGEGFSFTDAWTPADTRGSAGLARKIVAAGDKPVTIVLSRGLTVQANAGAFEVGPRLVVRAISGVTPTVVGTDLSLTLKPSESAVLGYSFR
ncbi:MAG: c-type cytochrome [Verrucomicrobiota bacterium]